MNVQIRVWADERYKNIYQGPQEDVPEKFKEAIAMIDASDSGYVSGVGNCTTVQEGRVYYISTGWFWED